MTIAEIESTLQELTKRHPNLDEAMLVTLLTSSGWEDKAIKDTVGVFRFFQKKNIPLIKTGELTSLGVKNEPKTTPVVSNTVLPKTESIPTAPASVPPKAVTQQVAQPALSPQENNTPQMPSMVYYTGTGEEEETLPLVTDDGKEAFKRPETKPVVTPLPPVQPVVEEVKKEEKKVEIVEEVKKEAPVRDIKEMPQNTSEPTWVIDKLTPPVEEVSPVIEKKVTPEPQSLITPPPLVRPTTPTTEPPENLPLKPFESTGHVWSFSKYKELFHRDAKNEEVVDISPKHEEHIRNEDEGESLTKKIKIKRTGFDGEDESLIFLTGVTLFIILILLAYMYSNGRL